VDVQRACARLCQLLDRCAFNPTLKTSRTVSNHDVQKPFFRTTTGLIPSSVWSSSFGTDRGQLIGHKLDPAKLEAKISQNLAALDLHLAMLEPTFKSGKWAIPTPTPSLADISLYYQLKWGVDIAAGRGIHNLTGGAIQDTQEDEAVSKVFNETRYPGLWKWFHAFEAHISTLPDLQTTNPESWLDAIRKATVLSEDQLLVPTAVEYTLDVQRDLVPGVSVSVTPDDTGRDNPTLGTLVKIGVEEVVVKPNEKMEVDVRVHFPRLGFVVKVVDGAKL
jgi:hypothetical protein